MFRLGGSTSGITSGLDSTRKGYADGGIDYDKLYGKSQKIVDKYYPQKGADLNRFLIDWGLSMVGNPPSGNVLQTAAKEAQRPTRELFESMDRGSATRGAMGADIFGKMIAAEGEMMGGEGGAKWRDQWALNKVKTAYQGIYKLKGELEGLDATADAARIKDINYDIGQFELDISQLEKDNPLLKTFAANKEIVGDLYDAVRKKYEGMKETITVTEENITEFPNNKIGDTITRDVYLKKSPEIMAAIIEEIQNMFGGTSLDVSILLPETQKATGGRVGYQGGELVEDINVEETIQPGGMPSPATPEIEPVGMTFEELRARLPETITDDIVILLSQSAQALEDFATIQTQQDVDNFNTKYNVNLVLPSEG